MVVTCLRSTLKDAVSVVERFTGKNPSLPIIGNILLKVDGQKIILKATNLEVGIEVTIPAKVTKEGVIAIPPRILSSILQTIPDEKISLEEKNNKLYIETEFTKSEIYGMDTKDFPILPAVKQGNRIQIQDQVLFKILSHILPVITISDFKPEISGLHIRTEKTHLVFAGTDSFRLAEERTTAFEGDKEIHFIIPLRPLQELVKIISVTSGEVKFLFNKDQVQINIGNTQIITQLIQGAFPDYKNLVPKEFSTTVRALKTDLLVGTRLTSVFASKLNDVLLSYQKDRLILEIVNPDVGKHTKEMKAEVLGKSGHVGFNHRYLSDAIDAIESETVFLGISDETRPTVVKDESNPSFFSIIMPLRI
ncbi:MAG: DNA polymerase III subunit beta [Candidatus Sungbacteria bacterium]|uniref:Beta sliding clamp n=1 Tax=Candidatus Sungiibacteriota bacterium TaxID=2750080 RepID=A0A931SAV8_9BACT|nr:DNA polymerase III subunit beta [Candidatus Sungbacteria bacterium]